MHDFQVSVKPDNRVIYCTYRMLEVNLTLYTNNSGSQFFNRSLIPGLKHILYPRLNFTI